MKNYYGYPTQMILDKDGFVVGFGKTYPLRENETLCVQAFIHQIGDHIRYSWVNGYATEQDVSTFGT